MEAVFGGVVGEILHICICMRTATGRYLGIGSDLYFGFVFSARFGLGIIVGLELMIGIEGKA